MSLPKLQSPYFPVTIPSTKRKIKIRPFTVKEEKLLLMAATDRTETQYVLSTIQQILGNCIDAGADGFDVKKLATFDVEYLFVQLRARSVNNIMELKFKDDEDQQIYETSIDLDQVAVYVPEGHSNKIVLNDTYTITMNYPTFDTIKPGEENGDTLELIAKSIDLLVNTETDEIVKMSEFSKKDVLEFIDSFSSRNMRDIEVFFTTMPTVKLDIKYITKEGKEKVKEVVGLLNFFTF